MTNLGSLAGGSRVAARDTLARILVGAVIAAPLVLAAAPPAAAQWGDSYEQPGAEPYDAPPRRRSRDYSREDAYRNDGGYGQRQAARRYTPPPQEAPRQFYWPWEERPQQAQPQPEQPRSQPTYRPPRPRPPVISSSPGEVPARVRRPRPAPAIAQPKPAVPKATPNVQIAVFGDSLAGHLSRGLDDAFEENADVAITDRARGDSGLVRKDLVDWPKAADDYLKANPKVSYALVMLGANDRQPIREGDQSFEPLSDRWREIYRDRVDTLIKVFTDSKIPLIWVGTPPMRSESLAKDLASINDIYRERVQKAGQTYVDVWPGFVDDRNRYAVSGPDLEGQEARLRTSDGVHFTNAGARKLAHFADVELKRLMGASGVNPADQPAAVAATPGSGLDASGKIEDTAAIDRRITAMLPSLPEPPGIPALPVKPLAGPVVPLGRTETSPGGALISARPRDGDAAGTVERVLQRGAAPSPQPGRADDFKWPPG